MPLTHISLWEVHPSVYGSLALSNTYIAGLGGSVLANRLSANPNNRVLLIEAGPRFVIFHSSTCRGLIRPSDTVDPFVPIPFLCTTLAPSVVSWNYTTVPQTGLGGRSIAYPRGRTLGGSTSISTLESRSGALTTDLEFSRLYGLDPRTSERLRSIGQGYW
jgi:hypothetical protein